MDFVPGLRYLESNRCTGMIPSSTRRWNPCSHPVSRRWGPARESARGVDSPSLSRYERVQLISAYQRQVAHYQALFYGEIARLYAQELSEGPRGRGRGLGLGGPHRARGGRPVSATWSPSVVVITVACIGSGGGIHPSLGLIISGSRRSDTATPPVAGRSRLEPWEDMSSRTLKR